MARDFVSGNLDGGDVTFFDDLDYFSYHIEVLIDSDDSADMMIWQKSPTTFDNGISFFLDDVGPTVNHTYELYHAGGGQRLNSSVANNVDFGSWQSVGGNIVWDVTDGTVVYVDGSSIGTCTVNGYTGDSNSLLFGMHSNSGDRRYLNGKLARITFWNEELTADEFTDLSNGEPPSSIRPGAIIRHWPILGDTSPEPEAIDGTDTLSVTSATQTSSQSITASTLSAASLTTSGTTGTAEVTCSRKGGALYCYVSTSGTPPSTANHKSGTGAVFHSSTVVDGIPYDFPSESELIADADNGDSPGAIQGIATDGTWYFVSYSDKIYTYNSSWVYQSDIDCTGINSGLHTQVNGMYVDGSTLYITANEFPTTTSSWVYDFTINSGTGALTSVGSNQSLSAGGTAESITKTDDGWWVSSHNKHGLDLYNTSWVHQGFEAFPTTLTENNNEVWQGHQWFGDYVVVNIHDQNSQAPRTDVYYWNGSSFETYKTQIAPPTTTCTQGIYRDGEYMLWANRKTASLGGIQRSTISRHPVDGVNQFAVTGLTVDTDYYVHFLHDAGLGEEDIHSSVLTANNISDDTTSVISSHYSLNGNQFLMYDGVIGSK